MSCQSIITITHGKETITTIKNKILHPASKPKEMATALLNYFNAIRGGDRDAKLVVQVSTGDGAFATGTITLSSFVATNTITIAGVVYTGVSSAPTGNQFLIGASDTLTAANAAAVINQSSSVSATSVGAVITLLCKYAGKIGNYIPTVISANGTASGATLSGGTEATTYSTVNTYHLGV